MDEKQNKTEVEVFGDQVEAGDVDHMLVEDIRQTNPIESDIPATRVMLMTIGPDNILKTIENRSEIKTTVAMWAFREKLTRMGITTTSLQC